MFSVITSSLGVTSSTSCILYADDYKKQNLEMMNNLVGMLSKNPASIKSMSYKVQGSDGTAEDVKTELSVTMKDDGQVHQPCDHHLVCMDPPFCHIFVLVPGSETKDGTKIGTLSLCFL
jgi:hypothetical protein